MPTPRELGSAAEDRAAAYLLSLGYTVVTRRFKTAKGEIDIVALDGDVMVFVEVRYRGRMRGVETIDERKVAHLREAAGLYLHKMDLPDQVMRFDVVSVGDAGLEHLVDAFR